MGTIRLGLLLVTVAAAPALSPMAARAQAIICCSHNIDVDGHWVGSGRVADCQGYFNSAATAILRRMCQQRQALSCINTARCSELPPEETAAPDPATGDSVLPSDPNRDGLEQGFYGTPPPAPPAPPAGRVSPPRLAYLVMRPPGNNKPVTSFTVWLDRNACPLALGHNNRLADSAAARYVVRGKVIHRDGRVHIEADAQERPGGAKLGPFTGEAEGEDAAAVAKATRAVTGKLQLVCAR